MGAEQKPIFTLAHIGINAADDSEARQFTDTLADIFGFDISEGKTNYFLDDTVEIMKSPGKGSAGHIAFCVDNLEAAIRYLEGKEVLFDRKYFKYDEAGNIAAAYLQSEIAGFALHLIERKTTTPL